MTSLKTLTLQKEKLQQQIDSEEEAINSLKEKLKDLVKEERAYGSH